MKALVALFAGVIVLGASLAAQAKEPQMVSGKIALAMQRRIERNLVWRQRGQRLRQGLEAFARRPLVAKTLDFMKRHKTGVRNATVGLAVGTALLVSPEARDLVQQVAQAEVSALKTIASHPQITVPLAALSGAALLLKDRARTALAPVRAAVPGKKRH